MAEPNILDPLTQQAWDRWCDARIRAVALPIIDAAFDIAVEEHVRGFNEQAERMIELIGVVKALKADNASLSRRVRKSFPSVDDSDDDDALSRTLGYIDEVLAN